MAYIHRVGQIPGPASEAVWRRMASAVPAAVRVQAPVIRRAAGGLVEDIDGNHYIDLTGGVGALNLGHCAESSLKRIKQQLGEFLHTDFSNVPYLSYVSLAERLNLRYPRGADALTLFFNSGAEAVENAVKLARLYTGRPGVLAAERGFHGRTWMALALSQKIDPYKAGMGPFATEVYTMPYPYPYRDPNSCRAATYAEWEERLVTNVDLSRVGAVIVEPVQGEGGIVVPPFQYLRWLRDFTERHHLVLIVDEIQTGFGRTGSFFAVEQAGIIPDLMTVGKSIAAGLPLSAVMGSEAVMSAARPGQLGGTYVGNPVAIAAAHGVLDQFDAEPVLAMAQRQGEVLAARLEAWAGAFPWIGEVRGLGPMRGVEVVKDRTSKDPDAERTSRWIQMAQRLGVLLLGAGFYGNVVRFLAPLTMPPDMLEEALDAVEAAAGAL